MNVVRWPNGVTSPDHKISYMTFAAMWWWQAGRGGALPYQNEWFSVSRTNEEES